MPNSDKKKRVLITGANGQLAQELQSHPDCKSFDIIALNRTELDIGNENKVFSTVNTINPGLVINTAAYTAVDLAETESDLAFRINSEGPANLAKAVVGSNSRLLHISTDFVFDGRKHEPYMINDEAHPISVYGSSKLEGEKKIQQIAPLHSTIIRSSWIYSIYGKNFVKTMLSLMNEREKLNIVCDQTGTPTWARNLAATIWKIAATERPCALYHVSDNGATTWFEFALAIYIEAKKLGLISGEVQIQPIPTEQYPTAARRPGYSVLGDKIRHPLTEADFKDWKPSLQKMLLRLSQNIDSC